MNKRNKTTSIIFLVLSLIGCVAQSEVVPTLSLPTQTSVPAFTSTIIISPTESVLLANIPSSVPTLESFTKLETLSLPEFNARYSTRDIVLTLDRQTMAVISKDKSNGDESIWLWNVNDFDKSLVSYYGVVDDIHSIAFSPDDQNLAVGGQGKIAISNWKTGKLLENVFLSTPKSDAVEIVFGPQNTLLSSDYAGKLTVWNLTTKEAKYSVELTPAFVSSSFVVSPDGKTLVTGLYEKINLWNFETGQLISVIGNPDDAWYTHFSFSPNQKFVATGGCNKFGFESCAGGKLLIWDASFENPSLSISNYPSSVSVFEFSSDSGSLATLTSNIVELLDLSNGHTIHVPSLNHVAGKLPPKELLYIFDMAYLSDNGLLVVSTTEGLQILNIDTLAWMPDLMFILSLGFPYTITSAGDNLNFRKEPSLKGEIIKKLHEGDWFGIIDGPKIADEYVWWKVKIADSTEGWIVEMPGWYEFNP